jgi:signal transduction histidine kinase
VTFAGAESKVQVTSHSFSSALRRPFSGARARILALGILLLGFSTLTSILFVRQVLLTGLDEEINRAIRQEMDEFSRLVGGRDPRTGEPFGSNVRAIFDTYFSRELPDEGEALISFVDGRVYKTRAAADAPLDVDELGAAIRRWAALEQPRGGTLETAGGPLLWLASPIEDETGATIGTFVVANFPEGERREINNAIRTASEVSVAVFVVASLLAWGLAGRALAPLRLLNETARSITESDLSRRIPVTSDDELSQVARTFNEMLDRLEAAFGTQRQFVDDAGHELRTPITVIRGHLELLEDDPRERQETIALVMDELDRMGRIVNDLLLLAQSQEPDFLDLEAVEVASLVAEVHAKAQALGSRRWSVETGGPGKIVADRQRLTQALMQLAQNAVEYTQEEDSVDLGGSLRDGEARLWVRDSGPGIPLEEQERIFERFTRGRDGRRRRRGAGLGLSIVRAIAEAHRGRIELWSRPGVGSSFEIVVPVDPPIAASATTPE